MGACLVSGRGGPSQLDSAGRASRRRDGGRRVASPHGARLAAALRAAVGGGKFHQLNEARGGTVVACPPVGATIRSEERRVGKECRSRWSAEDEKADRRSKSK